MTTVPYCGQRRDRRRPRRRTTRAIDRCELRLGFAFQPWGGFPRKVVGSNGQNGRSNPSVPEGRLQITLEAASHYGDHNKAALFGRRLFFGRTPACTFTCRAKSSLVLVPGSGGSGTKASLPGHITLARCGHPSGITHVNARSDVSP